MKLPDIDMTDEERRETFLTDQRTVRIARHRGASRHAARRAAVVRLRVNGTMFLNSTFGNVTVENCRPERPGDGDGGRKRRDLRRAPRTGGDRRGRRRPRTTLALEAAMAWSEQVHGRRNPIPYEQVEEPAMWFRLDPERIGHVVGLPEGTRTKREAATSRQGTEYACQTSSRFAGHTHRGPPRRQRGEQDIGAAFVVDLELVVEAISDDPRQRPRTTATSSRRCGRSSPARVTRSIETLAERVALAAAQVSGAFSCRATVHKPAAAERLDIADVSAEVVLKPHQGGHLSAARASGTYLGSARTSATGRRTCRRP